MANTTIPVVTPTSATITASSASALDTAVATQVNTLVQQFVNPKNTGATPGTVQNESIVISPSSVVFSSGNESTWYATVRWFQWTIPH